MKALARLGSLLVTLAVAAPALAAAPSAPIGTACLNLSGASGCAGIANFNGAWDPAISPDGKNVYVAAFDAKVVWIFDRNTTTGALTLKQGATRCIATSLAGCTPARLIQAPTDVQVSPDGKNVYVTGSTGTGIAIFDRDTATGVLTQKSDPNGCISDDGSADGVANVCINGRAIGPATGIFFSPDKAFVYLGPESNGAWAEFARNTSTGALTQLGGTAGCVTATLTADGCSTAAAISAARQADMSPDGLNFYAPTSSNNGILIFDRDPQTGGMSQKPGAAGCITSDGFPDPGNNNQLRCAKVPGLTFANAATVSADGKQVYVGVNGGMFTFARAADGKLTLQGCISDPAANGCVEGRHLSEQSYASLSPDGLLLVSTSDFFSPTGGLTLFDRDPVTGTLTQPPGVDACVTQSGGGEDNGNVVAGACRARPELGLDGQPVFANNSQFYVGFYTASDLTIFKRDFYPQCSDTALNVPFQTSTAVALSCSDANGDAPITLAITSQPISGQLGAIDQPNSRVFYNPFNGFSGADSFKFTGTAAGLTSAPATASMNVAAKPPTQQTDLDGDGSFTPQDCNDTNPAIHPGAFDIPGNGVDEDCSGADTPLPTPKVTSGVSHSWNALKKFTTVIQLDVSSLTAGAAVTVVCKAKGCPFKSKRQAFPKATPVAHFAGLFKTGKKHKVAAKLKVGGTVEVDITAPNSTGKFVSFKIRPKKVPLVVAGCLKPGTTSHTAC